MAVAITSALTGLPVSSNMAMTGEITLRGRILPIGGLKEKLIAALRGGIENVLIPKENERDLKEISAKVKRRLNLILVENMDEVLEHALVAEDSELFRETVEYPLEEIFGVEPTVEAPAGVN
jgi:ATP-dependent Lon protease